MSGEADIETRRKRLLYRSIYRGNKENDILLGQFARAHIASFDSAELDQYERLLDTGDNDIFDWVSAKSEVPAEADTPVLRKLMAFRVNFQ
jgi:antitoxin CptB